MPDVKTFSLPILRCKHNPEKPWLLGSVSLSLIFLYMDTGPIESSGIAILFSKECLIFPQS